MKSICLVTSNLGKIEEISRYLEKFGIEVIAKKMEIPEIGDEQGEIAKGKAKYAVEKLKVPAIVEDTGIYFEDYNNFPGIHTKFVFKSIGYEGVLKLLESKPRKAYFKTVIAYCEPEKDPKVFIGINHGKIAENIRGTSHPKLPYDSIFIPDGEDRTFAEMAKEEKAKHSARAKATEEFAKWFVPK